MNVLNVLLLHRMIKVLMYVLNVLLDHVTKFIQENTLKEVIIQYILILRRYLKNKTKGLFRLLNQLLESQEEQIQKQTTLILQLKYFAIIVIALQTILSLKFHQWQIQFCQLNLLMNNQLYKNGSLNCSHVSTLFFQIRQELKRLQKKVQLIAKSVN